MSESDLISYSSSQIAIDGLLGSFDALIGGESVTLPSQNAASYLMQVA